MKNLTEFDRANIFHKKLPGGVRKGVTIPPPVLCGMQYIMMSLRSEGIENPDYEVVRDWEAFRKEAKAEREIFGCISL